MARSSSANEYVRLTPTEHLLERADMYLGSLERHRREVLVYNYLEKVIEKREITSPVALEHIFVEIISNVADNIERSREQGVNPGNVEIEMTSSEITVKNYGRGIAVDKHKSGLWAPELIFGTMMTSSNYRKENNMAIGQNGIGAKGTNVMSKFFEVICVDQTRKLKYRQVWENNMRVRYDPEIEKTREKTSTTVTYSPDFERFGMSEFSEDDMFLYAGIAASLSFTKNVIVTFNGEKIHVKNAKDYAKLLVAKGTNMISHSEDHYDLVIADTPYDAKCISFVNGQRTVSGTHVDESIKCVTETFLKIFADSGVPLRKNDIQDHVTILINCNVPNPKFDSQNKKNYTGGKIKISIPTGKLSKIKKWKMAEVIRELVEGKQLRKLKKTEKVVKKRIDDPDCVDANEAGKKSGKCVLILNEGKSAMGYAKKFVKHYPGQSGHDYYGMIPLKGKPLNTYNAKFERMLANKEFAQIKMFMGLKEEVDYTKEREYKKLRYGTVWIMVDADNDGKHIAGLLLLFFMRRFPSIIERGMIKLFRTPIIRAKKGRIVHKFYTEQAYEEWEEKEDTKGWNIKYYKGLASNTDKDIAEDHKNPNIITFTRDVNTMETLLKAFDKTRAEDRKKWLKDFVQESLEDLENAKSVDITTFIDQEMIHHAFASLERGIPEIDGFKEAARKVFYSSEIVLKKNSELKVTLLASATSERCNYKYGEKSLQDAIATSAMEVIGTNNLPIFKPEGIIGSRDSGRNESAPRYIFVGHNWWTPLIFRKEDKIIMEQDVDEGMKIEWKTYYPILPTILFNMITGLSTAYRTQIPPFHPLQLAQWIIEKLDGVEDSVELVPWFRGHNGTLKRRVKGNGFTSYGRYYVENGDIIVEELPARLWTNKYKKFLIKKKEKGLLEEYYPIGEGDNISFRLVGWTEEISMQKLGLVKRFSFKNLTILDRKGNVYEPIVFKDVNALMEHFFKFRYSAYVRRKEKILRNIEKERDYTKERCRFVRYVINGKLKLNGVPINDVVHELKDMGFVWYEDHLDKVKSRHFTKEEVAKLEKKVKLLEEQFEGTKEMSVEDIWKNEIYEFVDEFKKNCPNDLLDPVYEDEDDNSERVSEGEDEGEDEEEDEEFFEEQEEEYHK